tara:strand:- start:47 stop:1687 length:1641 start_codon:yes stop_codon:yes gene_type:complete
MADERLGGAVEGRFFPGVTFDEIMGMAQRSQADFFEYGDEMYITETGETILSSIASLNEQIEESGDSLNIVPGTYLQELEKLKDMQIKADSAKVAVKDTIPPTSTMNPIISNYTAKDSTTIMKIIEKRDLVKRTDEWRNKSDAELDSFIVSSLMKKSIDKNLKPDHFPALYTDMLHSVQDKNAVNKNKNVKATIGDNVSYISEVPAVDTSHQSNVKAPIDTTSNKVYKNKSGDKFQIQDGKLVFNSYQAGLSHDISVLNDKIQSNLNSMNDLKSNVAGLDQYLDAYYRMYGALPSNLQVDDPLNPNKNNIMTVDNVTGTGREQVDPSDPFYLAQESSIKNNKFPKVNSWHFWSEPKDNMRKRYMMNDADFKSALIDYESILSESGDERWMSGAQDDIFMDGTREEKIARVSKKYGNNKHIVSFYTNALDQFDRVQDQYNEDNALLLDLNNIYTEQGREPTLSAYESPDVRPGAGANFVSQVDPGHMLSGDATSNAILNGLNNLLSTQNISSTPKGDLYTYQNYISENVLYQRKIDELMRYYDALAK